MHDDWDLTCSICGNDGGRVLPDPGTLPADTVMCLPCEGQLGHVILGLPYVEPWTVEQTAGTPESGSFPYDR